MDNWAEEERAALNERLKGKWMTSVQLLECRPREQFPREPRGSRTAFLVMVVPAFESQQGQRFEASPGEEDRLILFDTSHPISTGLIPTVLGTS